MRATGPPLLDVLPLLLDVLPLLLEVLPPLLDVLPPLLDVLPPLLLDAPLGAEDSKLVVAGAQAASNAPTATIHMHRSCISTP